MAQYQFVPKEGSQNATRPWCFVSPESGALLPGEGLRVNVTLLVNLESARALTLGKEKLEDILVIHIAGSSDAFLSISGTWQPSVFGLGIDTLCRMSKPIREYTVEELVSVNPSNKQGTVSRMMSLDGPSPAPPETQDHHLSIPKELWRLVDFIYKFGMDVDALFEGVGNAQTMAYIRECLDRGLEFDSALLLLDDDSDNQSVSEESLRKGQSASIGSVDKIHLDVELLLKTTPRDLAFLTDSPISILSKISEMDLPLPQRLGRSVAIHSFVAVLYDFVESLGVIPPGLYARCLIEGAHSPMAAKQVLYHAPVLHYNVFIYLTSFLRECLVQYRGAGGMHRERLGMCFCECSSQARIWSPLLLRDSLDKRIVEGDPGTRRVSFLMHFLEI